MTAHFARALERWGAFLLRPQRTVASLPPDEGAHDGWWLGLLYVLGSQLVPVGQAIKSVTVMMNGSAFVTLASQAGRILLPPILLMLVVEFLVGPSKSYRGALYLLPMIIVATGANLARQMGLGPIGDMTALLVGAAWSLGLVIVSRSSIPSVGKAQEEAAA